jgi:hypothetical protein
MPASSVEAEELMVQVSEDEADTDGYDQLLANPATTTTLQSSDGEPSLTVAQVKEKWEFIKRRIKTRKDGHKIAAFLNSYAIVGVEGSTEIPVVVIRAGGTVHYNTLQKPEYQETIEWAAKVELEQECRVRMLPPGQGVPLAAIPPPLSNDGSSSSASTRMAVAPQQSAYLERPAPMVQTPRAAPPGQERERLAPVPEPPVVVPTSESIPAKPELSASPLLTNGNMHTSPLARTSMVRENSSTIQASNSKAGGSSETRRASVEKKARVDPVVQEVVRMFKAEINEIHLK